MINSSLIIIFALPEFMDIDVLYLVLLFLSYAITVFTLPDLAG